MRHLLADAPAEVCTVPDASTYVIERPLAELPLRQEERANVITLPYSPIFDRLGNPQGISVSGPPPDSVPAMNRFLVVPGLRQISLAELAASRHWPHRRGPPDGRRIVIDRDGVLPLTVLRSGAEGHLTFRVACRKSKSASPSGEEDRQVRRNPNLEILCDGASTLVRDLIPGQQPLIEARLPRAVGTQLIEFRFSGFSGGTAHAHLIVDECTISEQSGFPSLLLSSKLDPAELSIRYPVEPPPASQRISPPRGAPKPQWVELWPGTVSVVSESSHPFSVFVDGVEVGRNPGPDSGEVFWSVSEPCRQRLEIKTPAGPSGGPYWLVQPDVTLAKLHRPESPPVPVRGREREHSQNHLVRHVSVGEDTRWALLLSPASEMSFPVHFKGGGVLEFALASIRLDGAPGPRQSPAAEILLRGPDGRETSLFRQPNVTPSQWSAASVPWPSNIGPDHEIVVRSIAAPTLAQASRDVCLAVAHLRFVPERIQPRPNVLVYLVDTLRADHLSAYGYSRQTSPALDAMAEESLLFERAYVHATWTRPSVASLFTGLLPSFHGVSGGKGLAATLTTLAEELRSRGYLTVSVTASPNVHGTGLNFEQGFEQVYGLLVENADPPRADEINDVFIPWLEVNHKRPFFAYVHTIDPHAPYDPPASVSGTYSKPYTGAVDLRLVHPRDLCDVDDLDDRDVSALLDVYDEEVLFNDMQFQILLNWLRAHDVYDNTVIVFVSDHGEEFGDHGLFGHGNFCFWEELLRVPLVVKPPKGHAKPRRIPESVRVLDLLPTILSVVDPQGEFNCAGVDLIPWAADPNRANLPVIAQAAGDAFCLLLDQWKLMQWPQRDPESVALFDLQADPQERLNLTVAEAERVEWLQDEYQRLLDSYRSRGTEPAEAPRENLTPAEIEALRLLGYIDG